LAKALGVAAAALLAAFAYLWFRPASIPPIEAPGAISALEEIELGGVRQWITVRAHDPAAPVLLYLHEGPGFASIAFARSFTEELEKRFVVVQWDRRGAGKSCDAREAGGPATLGRLYADLSELTDRLRERFDKRKIFLVAKSGGGVLGALAAARRPDLFHAYAGVSQIVHVLRNEQLAHTYAVEAAEAAGDSGAVAELQRLVPPYADPDAFFAQRELLGRFGGDFTGEHGPHDYLVPAAKAPEYTLRDKFRFLPCLRASIEDQWEEFWEVDMFEAAPRFEIPVLFLSGTADRVTPPALVAEYVESIEAPWKELIFIEGSAHYPELERPQRFQQVLIEKFAEMPR
jgi:pimeloyl-ACP methyl ester carboxylesterase